MNDVLRTRRQMALGLGAGLAAPALAPPSLAMAAPDPGLRAINRPIVAAVKPSDLAPNQTIETSHDVYRRMTAPVFINDQGPYFFVVDTGANRTVISRELSTMLGLQAGETMQLNGVADVMTTPTVVAPRVRVGGRVERDVVMPTLPEAAIGAAGLLGVDRLGDRKLRLDFRKRELTVGPSIYEEPEPFTTIVPARRRAGQLIIVQADLAGIPVAAFIDSGAERTIGNAALMDLTVQRLPSTKLYEVPIISVTGTTIPGRIALLPVLRMGSVRLVNIPMTFADLHIFQIWGLTAPAVLVGMDALSTFDAVTIDFGRAQVGFQLVPGPHTNGYPTRSDTSRRIERWGK